MVDFLAFSCVFFFDHLLNNIAERAIFLISYLLNLIPE